LGNGLHDVGEGITPMSGSRRGAALMTEGMGARRATCDRRSPSNRARDAQIMAIELHKPPVNWVNPGGGWITELQDTTTNRTRTLAARMNLAFGHDRQIGGGGSRTGQQRYSPRGDWVWWGVSR